MSSIRRYCYPLGTPIGYQDIINLNQWQSPFEVTVNVKLTDGSASYFLEVSTDEIGINTGPDDMIWETIDPVNTNSSDPNITGISDIQTDSARYALTTPYTACRLNIIGLSGNIKFVVIQDPGRIMY